jgi:hypothetical protein
MMEDKADCVHGVHFTVECDDEDWVPVRQSCGGLLSLVFEGEKPDDPSAMAGKNIIMCGNFPSDHASVMATIVLLAEIISANLLPDGIEAASAMKVGSDVAVAMMRGVGLEERQAAWKRRALESLLGNPMGGGIHG